MRRWGEEPFWLYAAVAALAAVVFILDLLLAPGVAVWLLYVPLVVLTKLVSWRPLAPLGVAVATSVLVSERLHREADRRRQAPLASPGVDAAMTAAARNDAELAGLLEAVYRRYHYDFRRYAPTHLRRRIALAGQAIGSRSVEELTERVLSDEAMFARLLHHLTIPVSDLFRDPGYYVALREKVLPELAAHASLRVWVAGCAGGEEVYSLAIVLHEEGLLGRSLIYATDIDAAALRRAAAGSYDIARVPRFSESYFRSGGRASLSDYYTAASSGITFVPLLRQRVVFSDHCLATDAAFAEVQLVSCRNVLIYFDRSLQDRAVGLFRDSLSSRGFLGLGAKETLAFSSHRIAFDSIDPTERLFRLRGPY